MARQVLPLVGAVVGAVWFGGNWQAGYAVGAAVGNAVDPLVITGPQIGEAATQTAQEGVPWPQLAGTNRFAGNLIFKHLFPPVTVKSRESKGGGPITKSQRLYGTFAIGLAMNLFDGPGRRNGLKVLLKIWKRDTLIYDVSPTSTILRESAELAKTFRWHPGNDTQGPDPDLEAILGVGNANAYRGRSLIVFFNVDLTDTVGAVDQYHFECATEGTQGEQGGGWLFGPVARDGSAGGPQNYYLRADSPEELPFATPIQTPAWITSAFDRICRTTNGTVFIIKGSTESAAVSFDFGASWLQCDSPLTGSSSTYNVYWNGSYYYCWTKRSADGIHWENIPNLPIGTIKVVAREFFGGPLVAEMNHGVGIYVSLDDGGTWSAMKSFPTGISNIEPGKLQFQFSLSTTIGYRTYDNFDTVQANGGSHVSYEATYSDEYQDAWIRKSFANKLIWSKDGGKTFEESLTGIAYGSNSDNNVAWGEYTWAVTRVAAGTPIQHFINLNREGGKPGGWSELANPIYGNGGNLVWTGSPTAGIATSGTVTVADVIKAVARRCKLPESVVAVDHLATAPYLVRGLLVGSQDYTGADVITTLCRAYLLIATTFDGKLQFVPRGGETVADLTEDDLVDDVSEDDGDWHLFNNVEQPAKIILFYQNAGINYAPAKAEPPFVGYIDNAVTEVAFQVPVVLRDVDEAPQLVDKLDKIRRTESRGEITRAFCDKWTKLVPGSVIHYTERAVTRRVIITHRTEWAGVIKCRLRLDQQSDVTSNVTSLPYATPKPPPPRLTGLTQYAWLNAPAIADTDDRFGFRVAGGSPLPGWYGWTLQQRTSSQLEFETADSFDERAVMGYLLNAVPAASAYGTDTTNVLRVALLDSRQDIEALTDLQFLQEGGGWALVRQDGTLELGQFRDVVEEGDGIYQLSWLARGRGNTGATAHVPGEIFVLLSSTRFVEVPFALLGQTLVQRAVSHGMTEEEAVEHTREFMPGRVQQEFPVSFLRATRSSSNMLTIKWSERRRLGTARNPVRSRHWLGYRVTLIKGGTTVVLPDQTSTSVTYDATAMGAGVTVRVQQINNITGLGPASEVTV